MKKILLLLLLSPTLFASAFFQMEKACERSVASACYEFGVLYERGLGVKQDSNRAKAYYLKACDLGFEAGCDAYRAIESLS
jgi:TPR repeat protein